MGCVSSTAKPMAARLSIPKVVTYQESMEKQEVFMQTNRRVFYTVDQGWGESGLENCVDLYIFFSYCVGFSYGLEKYIHVCIIMAHFCLFVTIKKNSFHDSRVIAKSDDGWI